MVCVHVSAKGRGNALNRASVVNRGAVLVLDSLSSWLSLISRVVCLLSLSEFPLHYPSACSAAVQCPSWYIDATAAFPRVPVRNFTTRTARGTRVPAANLTRRLRF